MDTKYYVQHENQELGPYSEAQLRERLTSGEINFLDLCRNQQMSEWSPINQTLRFEPVKSLPPTPSPISSKASSPPLAGSTFSRETPPTKINWLPALIFYGQASAFYIFSELASLGDNEYLAGVLSLIALAFYIPALILFCILHYKCWCAINKSHRATTPGKAVGFLFIPIYNLFWAYTTWPKLVDGLNSSGYRLPKRLKSLADYTALLFIAQFVFVKATMHYPLAGILLEAINLALFILLYQPIVKAINYTSNRTG